MSQNIIVFDIETKDAFSDVGGRECFTNLEISVLGAYDYADGKFHTYEEKELPSFAERLAERPVLVGFNSRKFDTPILQKYIRFDLKDLKQLDIMEEIVKELGHRVSLDSVAKATLDEGKSGSGLEAIRLWREGRMEELKRYCLDDVRLTRDVYEYGAAHGELLYVHKFGGGKARAKVSWKIENPQDESDTARQQTLF
ncbi:MAG: ribonuclease H-like domain-containing protein, partial [bacterium]